VPGVLNSGALACQVALYHLSHTCQPFFALVIFQIGYDVFAQAILDSSPSMSTSEVAGMTGMHHHTQSIRFHYFIFYI
jgi:hypothetical protein